LCEPFNRDGNEERQSANQNDIDGISLELGPEVANTVCDHCGHSFNSVNGFIKKDDSAYSLYFATLPTGHDDIEVGLTVNIGKWWDVSDSAVAERSWIYRKVWPSESTNGFEVQIEEPSGSKAHC
jgi:hypothetical protein